MKFFSLHFCPFLLRRLPQRLAFGLFIALALLQTPAWADPPGRVGRISEVEGPVWTYDLDAREWIEARRNRPLTSGDRLSTEAQSRAELQIGSISLQLGAATELQVLQLDDRQMVLQLLEGSLAARLRTPESAQGFELQTAEGRFRAQQPGRYRFDRDGAASWGGVAEGLLLFQSPDSGVFIYPGQEIEFWQDNGIQHQTGPLRQDAFSDWVASRDARPGQAVAGRLASAEMTGVDELDRYGRWQQTTEYGAVWTPTALPSDWAPYRAGHWAWISPWGWTWVDDAPWGFAPFHYGRWVWLRGNWGWAPGQFVARPVYAPALVGWVGAPPAGRGGLPSTVAWFPLAPHEAYRPVYRASPAYFHQLNRPHGIPPAGRPPGGPGPGSHYRYRDQPSALTRVPVTALERRQPIGAVRLQGPPAAAERGQPVRFAAPVGPGGRPAGEAPAARPPIAAAVPPAPGAVRSGPPGGAPRPAEFRAHGGIRPAAPVTNRPAPVPGAPGVHTLPNAAGVQQRGSRPEAPPQQWPRFERLPPQTGAGHGNPAGSTTRDYRSDGHQGERFVGRPGAAAVEGRRIETPPDPPGWRPAPGQPPAHPPRFEPRRGDDPRAQPGRPAPQAPPAPQLRPAPQVAPPIVPPVPMPPPVPRGVRPPMQQSQPQESPHRVGPQRRDADAVRPGPAPQRQ